MKPESIALPEMKPNHLGRLVVGMAAVILAGVQSSCTTSTADARRKIQEEGLIPYLVERHQPQLPVASPSELISYPEEPVERDLLSPPVYVSGVVTAQAVAGKPGFVYSPHTLELLEVDVTGFQAGERVRCPYTKEAFVVPGAPQSIPELPQSETQLAWSPRVETSSPGVAMPIVHPQVVPSDEPLDTMPLASRGEETVKKIEVSENLPLDPIPGRVARDGNPPPDDTEMFALPETEVLSMPVGKRVPGKPNYVYSPFAESNQVVDVEGHAPGSKVKCPYSGKIFEVPSATAPEPEELPEPSDSGS